MAVAGKNHGDVAFIGGGNDFGVADGAAGLDRGGGAGFGGGDEAVREREKSVAADHAAFERQAGFARFPNGDAAGIDAAHLAGADAERAARSDVNDGVGFDVLDDAPAEKHGVHLLIGGGAFGDDFHVFALGALEIAILQEVRAGADTANIQRAAAVGIFQHAHQAKIFFLLQQREGVGFEIGGDDDFGENFGDGFGAAQIERLVGGDDAAKGGLPVG